MKNTVKIVLTILLFAAMVVGTAVGFLLLSQGSSSAEQIEYTIAVDDEITVYAGDTYKLVPFLVRDDGTVEESRFRYTPSIDDIRVSDEGIVSVMSIPDPEEEVTIALFERNTSTSATVHVNVVSRLTNVLGITFSDAEGNKTLITGEQDLLFGEQYSIDVVTEPKNVVLQDYCTITVTDEFGREKQPFDVSFDGSHISLFVGGLGTGTLKIQIADDDRDILYNSSLEFTVRTANEMLGGEILRSEGETLLSAEEVASLARITLSSAEGDLSELRHLTSLRTVVLAADAVTVFENAPQGVCWRVPAALFGEYIGSEDWVQRIGSLIPYDKNADELYVVYHGAGFEGTDITYERIGALYNLPTEPQHSGYINTGWTDSTGNAVTAEEVRAVEENGLHLYAVWEPVEFTLVYNVRGSGVSDPFTETWNFDTERPLADLADFSDKAITGYKFSGWSTDSKSGYYDEADYKLGQSYGELTTESGGIIQLYDVWEPITYTMRFVVESDADPTVGSGNDKELKYGESYLLPAGVRFGYTFTAWVIGEEHYSAGQRVSNLSEEDGDVVELYPVWTENSYTIRFDPSGGHAAAGADVGERSVLFTTPISLPSLERSGYKFYYWYVDLDGDDVQDDGEPVYSANATVSRIVGDNEVWLRAVWSQSSYTVTFNLNGGERLEGENNVELDYEESLVLPSATRMGYTLLGWKRDGESELLSAGTAVSRLTSEDGDTVRFTAQWEENHYTVKFDAAGGTVSPESIDLAYTKSYSVPEPSRAGYDFLYWLYNGRTYAVGDTIQYLAAQNDSEVTLTAVWEGIAYQLNRSNGTQGDHINLSYSSGVADGKAKCGDTVVFSIATNEHSPKLDSVTWSGGSVEVTNSGNNQYSFTMPAGDVTITVSCTKDHGGSCFVAGTLIATENGYTAIENIMPGDRILSFNHETGQYEYSEVVFIYKDYREVAIAELVFENGKTLSLANIGQGLFDRTLNQYVLINAQNVHEFIGHTFAYAEQIGEEWITSDVRLQSANISSELVWRYDVVSRKNLNHVADGFLACSDVLVNICNMFAFEEDMTYDAAARQADIEKYGLFVYEEWSEYVTYKEFTDFNGAYFKVAVGKGLLTIDEIFSLIEELLLWEQ